MIRELLSRLRRVLGPRPGPIWRGVYPSFREVPVSGPGFGGTDWLRESAEHLRAVLQDTSAGLQPADAKAEYQEFALLLSALATPAQTLRVLDVGGGLGPAYAHARGFLSPDVPLEYTIVDNDATCEEGRRIFGSSPRFTAQLPAAGALFDAVLMNASLQYVDDYRGLLKLLSAYRPRLMVLSEIPAGPIRTFATAQYNHAGSVIPCWFFAEPELTTEMATHGYRRVYFCRTRREYDHQTFPVDLRLGRFATLVYAPAG